MNCYIQFDEDWVKGDIQNLGYGGKGLYVYTREGDELKYKMELWNPEIIFTGGGISITGYQKVKDENAYTMVSIDVRYTKPKKGKK